MYNLIFFKDELVVVYYIHVYMYKKNLYQEKWYNENTKQSVCFCREKKFVI